MSSRTASYSVNARAEVTPERAYELSGPLDPTMFYPGLGPLPAVVACQNQTGSWDTLGRTRTLTLSDGGRVVETITDATSPDVFAYELTDFQKLFGRLVSGARAEWRFEREAGGTSIRWTYTFFALPGRTGIVRAIVKLFWAPYMRQVLPTIAREVERLARSVA